MTNSNLQIKGSQIKGDQMRWDTKGESGRGRMRESDGEKEKESTLDCIMCYYKPGGLKSLG